MRRTISSLILMGGLIALGVPQSADARVNVDVHIGVPPPPTILFEHEPEVVVVPRTRVYYAPTPEYDVYRYGNYWYANRDGYWYRGASYRGPFAPIVYERVPRSIVVLPGSYHHHRLRPIHSSGSHNWHQSHDHDRHGDYHHGGGHGHGHKGHDHH